jgi:2-oxoglutarate dehydrogenase E2 component (dihydrolipoamide succinyltransferase)
MAIELKVPTVGESITEVQMGEWLKGEGDSVARDEVIAKIETDKVTVDLTAPNDGVLSQIKVKKGQTANVGDVVAYIEEGAGGAAKPKASEAPKAEAPKAEARKAEPPAETKSVRRRSRRKGLLVSCPPRVAHSRNAA